MEYILSVFKDSFFLLFFFFNFKQISMVREKRSYKISSSSKSKYFTLYRKSFK